METVSNYTETLEKTVRDLLERQEDLIRTAFTDQLTGLGNRGGFARSLEELWEQDTPVTMAFIDIDNLKHCNDVFGHDEGNRYILQVSLYLKLYMKVDEAAFRIGGDEFAILSTIATEDDLAERLEHCRTILLKNNDSEMPHSFSYGVAHADPALGEASNRMTLDADHRMYDYKLRHAMHLDRRNITQVHADDFEISDRIFDAFSMLNEGRYFFIENLDKHRTLWSQGALRDLGLPSEHIDNCRDYWKTRVHPDDLEACINDIDQVYNGTKHRRVMQYRVRNAVGDYVLCRARGFRIDGDGNVPSLYVGELVNHSLAETVDAATGLGTQRMLANAIDACRRDRCETGLIAVRVRGTTKLNELYGAEAVDNMLAEYAGRMLSITRGRSRVYRSRSVQFVVLSNDLDHEAFEQLTRHLKEAVFAPVRIAGDTITPVCLVVPAFYEHLTHQATAVLGELDRRLRTAGGLVPNDSLPIPEAERKSAIAERIDSLTGLYRPSEFMRRANAFLEARRNGTWCIATVDMGHMRLFNEWHGQAEGDRVLADVGTVLKDIENAGMGVAGYWGQDDFCVLIPFKHITVHQIYNRVREAVARYDGGVGFWPSMGVYPIDSNEEITIDAQAKAMFTNRRAKNDFKERIAIFCPEEYKREIVFNRTLTEFQYALSNGRITYYLQPQVDMETGPRSAPPLPNSESANPRYIRTSPSGCRSSTARCIFRSRRCWTSTRPSAISGAASPPGKNTGARSAERGDVHGCTQQQLLPAKSTAGACRAAAACGGNSGGAGDAPLAPPHCGGGHPTGGNAVRGAVPHRLRAGPPDPAAGGHPHTVGAARRPLKQERPCRASFLWARSGPQICEQI